GAPESAPASVPASAPASVPASSPASTPASVPASAPASVPASGTDPFSSQKPDRHSHPVPQSESRLHANFSPSTPVSQVQPAALAASTAKVSRRIPTSRTLLPEIEPV